MLRNVIKKWCQIDNGIDWEAKYIKLRAKHDKLCEYVSGIAEDRADAYKNILLIVNQENDFNEKFREDMRKHGENISKLDL